MAKKGSSGRHRAKRGKIRQQGANASDRKAAERAKQKKIAEERKGKSDPDATPYIDSHDYGD